MKEFLLFLLLLVFVGFPAIIFALCLRFPRFYLIFILIPIIGFILFIYPRPFKTTHLEYLLPENSRNVKADFKYAGLYYGCQMEGYSIGKVEYEKDSADSIVNSRRFSSWIVSLRGLIENGEDPYILDIYETTTDFDECYQYFENKYEIDLREITEDGGENYRIKIGGDGHYPGNLYLADTLIFSMSDSKGSKLIFLKGGN